MKATGTSSSSRGSYLVLIVQFIYVFQFILLYVCVLEQFHTMGFVGQSCNLEISIMCLNLWYCFHDLML